MALTNKLTAIADSIRAKTGSTNKLTLDEMPTAISNISSGGGDIPEEALNITGDCSYRFANNGWNWFIENCGNRITTNSITSARYMFAFSNRTSIPFYINLSTTSVSNVGSMFDSCSNLEVPPYITGKIGTCTDMFYGCYRLNYIPEDWATKIDWSSHNDGEISSGSAVFRDCYSLKKIPQNLIDNIVQTNPASSIFSYYPYPNQWYGCYVLEEIRNIPVVYYSSGNNSGVFGNTFSLCNRLKSLTFKTNNGTPIVAKWKNQAIDLTFGVGYGTSPSRITGYNSGLTDATRITDDASYQLLKDNPDSWTSLIGYSRYNHDSAVETINSLPDTSEYLATAGGTNTIKFEGAAGSATDGGAINTLTESEIAVATAKGWTVTFE